MSLSRRGFLLTAGMVGTAGVVLSETAATAADGADSKIMTATVEEANADLIVARLHSTGGLYAAPPRQVTSDWEFLVGDEVAIEFTDGGIAAVPYLRNIAGDQLQQIGRNVEIGGTLMAVDT